ncbi:MAG TPA: AsmA family protein [Steroidobacteraceae bacterium]|nr:AsmA family protein [Steroidobacteraceae bacterium]
MPPTLKWVGIAVAVIVATALLFLAWLELNPPREWLAHKVGASLGREVEIEELDLDVFTLQPDATVAGLTVLNPEWAGPGAAARIPRLEVAIELVDLLLGRLVITRLDVDRPDLAVIRDAAGRLSLMERQEGSVGAEPVDLPTIRSITVDSGRLQLRDAVRDIELSAGFAARESVAEVDRFIGAAAGRMNGQDFKLEIIGGPIANLEPGAAWPFRLELRAGQSHATANGHLARAVDPGEFDVRLDLQGPTLGTLYRLTGLALPETPPYSIQMRLQRRGMRYEIAGLEGQVGDSDLRGSGAIEVGEARPRLTATLSSSRLDLDDLRTVLGAPPEVGSDETASEKQAALARSMAEQQRLLPRARVDLAKMRALDASVTLEATDFRATELPIRAFRFDLELRDGRLVLDPLTVEFESGRTAGTLALDGSSDPPQAQVELALSNVELGSLVQYASEDNDPVPALQGQLESRVRLAGRGRSVHEIASSADGEITLVVPDGAIHSVLAELTGIDVAEALGLMLSEGVEQMGVRCAVAHLAADAGTLTLDTLVLDTEDVLITGKGQVALGAETLDIEIEGRPKKPRIIRARTGITVTGPLRNPEIGIEEENLLAQGAIGVALATLVTPVAGLLALIDPGLAEDENCAALIAEGRSESRSDE